MATYTELLTRIRLETNRDDIGASGEAVQALTDAISRAVEFYSDEEFWFNRASGSASTVASTATVAIPAALRTVRAISYSGCDLRKVALDDIEERTETGQPTCWAENGSTVRLHPIPNAAYSLSFYGLSSTAAPAGASSNYWTSEALDLISGRAKMILCRGVWRDIEGAQLAASEEAEALDKLRRETRRRSRTPLRSRGDEAFQRGSFNIMTG